MSPHLRPGHGATRQGLHRIAVHVLARRRFAVTGHFGLRAAPGGIATPAFGEDAETVRVSGVNLVPESGSGARVVRMNGATLAELGSLVGVDPTAPFTVGKQTPPLGDAAQEIGLDEEALSVIADWYDLGWRALDEIIGGLAPESDAVAIQLWPEHLDAATHVGPVSGNRVNLGFSPGDGFSDQPYAYVGPWAGERPGDPEYWNAPFGAVLRWIEVAGSQDPLAVCVDFLMGGLELLHRGSVGE
jgi:hypothetical protein